MSSLGLVKVVVYLKRRPDLTEEQFYEYWEKVHAPLVSPWTVKHGVVGYTQVRTPKRLRDVLSSKLEFDGVVELLVENFEKYAAAAADPYYVHVIEPDERKFIDKSIPFTLTMGIEKPIIMEGKPVIDVSKEAEALRKWEAKNNLT